MRIEPNSYKEITPFSIQNLKTLGLRIFFLICCSTFSFLPNVGLRLTLEYLTISPSSESHSFTTLIHFPSSGNILKSEYITHDPLLVPPFTPLLVPPFTRLPETSVRKTFDTGSNCTRPSCKPTTLIPLARRIRGGNTREISQE